MLHLYSTYRELPPQLPPEWGGSPRPRAGLQAAPAGTAILSEGTAQQPPLEVEPDICAWAARALDFQPDPIQTEVLRSEASRLILCCTRQWGKSTVTAVKALHYAFTHPGALSVVASPTAAQSGEWILKTREFLFRLQIKPKSDRIRRHSIVIPNGSRLVGLPGKPDNIVGLSAPDIVLIDEAARVTTEMMNALLPMLAAAQGKLWLVSTPKEQTGFFYDAWHIHAERFTRFKVTAEDCPRITKEFLEDARMLLGESSFQREFCCEFAPGETQIFTRELLERAFRPQPLFNGGKLLWS